MTVLAIIIGIIVLILIIPFGVSAKYNAGKYYLAARVIAFDVPILDSEKKDKKPKSKKAKKKPKKAKVKKEKEPKKERKLPSFTFEEILEVLSLALKTLAKFFRKIKINRLKLHCVIAADDPYETAVMYGYSQTLLALVTDYKGRAFKSKNSDISISSDFTAGEIYLDTEIIITLTLGKILAVLLSAGFGLIKIKARHAKEKEKPDISNMTNNSEKRIMLNGANAKKSNV